MGTLFPNGPEFPDHVPFPSLFLEAASVGLLVMLVAALLHEVLDHENHHPHTHTEPFVLMSPVIPAIAPPSDPPDPSDLTWMNNSIDAANIAIRNRHESDRRARIAMNSVINVGGWASSDRRSPQSRGW